MKKSLSSKKIRLQEQITLVSQLYTKLKEDLFILDGELAKLSAPIPAVSKQLKPTIPNPPGSAPVSVIKKKSFKDIYLAQQIKLEDQDVTSWINNFRYILRVTLICEFSTHSFNP